MQILKIILKIAGLLILAGIVLIGFGIYSGVKKVGQPAYYEENGKMYYTLYNGVNDKENPYLKKEIEDADPETFKVISSESTFHSGIIDILSADKNYVFIQESESRPVEKLVGADPKTIKQIGGISWLQDAKNVYLYGEKVDGADPVAFSEIRNPLYKDKNNVYLRGKVLVGADAKTFVEIDRSSYYKDKNNVYYCSLTDTPPPSCKIVVGADLSDFVIQRWSQDGGNKLDSDFAFSSGKVFYFGEVIVGADSTTFHKIGVGPDEYYKDANHTYKYPPETRAKIIRER